MRCALAATRHARCMTTKTPAMLVAVMLCACGADEPPKLSCVYDAFARPAGDVPVCDGDLNVLSHLDAVIARCRAGESAWVPVCGGTLAGPMCSGGVVVCSGAAGPACEDICPKILEDFPEPDAGADAGAPAADAGRTAPYCLQDEVLCAPDPAGIVACDDCGTTPDGTAFRICRFGRCVAP